VSSVSSAAQERDVSAWWKVDLAELLSTLCHHCSDLAGVVACSIVVKSRFGELFSAAGSAEWACALDDFQLSEEAGPTWECCTTGRAIKGERLDHRGLTGAHLGEAASAHGVVGCRAVPLSSQGETFGALSLYWGPSSRRACRTNTLTTPRWRSPRRRPATAGPPLPATTPSPRGAMRAPRHGT
jgi:hypothetical protein